jgi:hypothetical protein
MTTDQNDGQRMRVIAEMRELMNWGSTIGSIDKGYLPRWIAMLESATSGAHYVCESHPQEQPRSRTPPRARTERRSGARRPGGRRDG